MHINLSHVGKSIYDFVYPEGLSSQQKWMTVALGVAAFAVPLILSVIAPTLGIISSFFGGILSGICWARLIHNATKASENFEKFAEEHRVSDVHDQDVFLILTARDDHNGALRWLSSSTLSELKSQRNYKVICESVGSTTEFKEVIEKVKSQRNRIHTLWINAHGAPDMIQFGPLDAEQAPEGDIESSKRFLSKLLLKSTLQGIEPAMPGLKSTLVKLEKGASIVLASCSTGKNNGTVPCIAQQIADVVGNRCKVFAPTMVSRSTGTELKMTPQVEAKFIIPKVSQWVGPLKHIGNFFNEVLYDLSSGSYSKDITATFMSAIPT
jgi:hypothetical protein